MAQIGLTLPFSRKHEREADDLGLLYMADAGSIRAQRHPLEEHGREGGQRAPAAVPVHASGPEDRMGNLISRMSAALERYNAARGRGMHPFASKGRRQKKPEKPAE